MAADQVLELRLREDSGPEGVHHQGDRVGDTDGVGQLDFRSLRHPRRDEILRDVPSHVRGGAVHLRRVLPRERAAAMVSPSPVSVDDDLATRQARVALGPSDGEPPRRIDVIHRLAVQQVARQVLHDDFPLDFFPQGIDFHGGIMLTGDDHRVNPERTVPLVLHRDLGLAVGSQVGEDLLPTGATQAPNEAVSQHDWERHEFGGLAAGETEHHPLIPGPAWIHSHGDVRGLLVQGRQDRAGFVVESELGPGVPHLPDRVPGDPRDVDVALGGDLPRHQNQPGREESFAGDATRGVLLQDRIQDRVRDLVGDFIRMPFRHRFGREEIPALSVHSSSPRSGAGPKRGSRPPGGTAGPCCAGSLRDRPFYELRWSPVNGIGPNPSPGPAPAPRSAPGWGSPGGRPQGRGSGGTRPAR